MDDIVDVFARGAEAPLPDPRGPSDALLTDMVALRVLPPRERAEALEPYLERWRAQNFDALTVARYLALAGLELGEACELDDLVASRVRADWRTRAQRDVNRGIASIAAGLLVFALGTSAGSNFPVWGIVLLVCAAVGFRLLFRGIRTMRRITPISD